MLVKSVDFVSSLYPDVDKRNILITWNRNKTTILYLMGFGYCSTDQYMIKTDQILCAICGKKFRRRTRNKKWSD